MQNGTVLYSTVTPGTGKYRKILYYTVLHYHLAKGSIEQYRIILYCRVQYREVHNILNYLKG